MVFLLPYSLPQKGGKKNKALASCITLVIPSNKFPQIPPSLHTCTHSLSLSHTYSLSHAHP